MANLTEKQAMAAYKAIVAGLEKQRGYAKGELLHEEVVRQGGGATWPSKPVLVRDFEGWSTDTAWAICWEEGPYEWVHYLDGGIEEEFGFELVPVSVPAGIHTEPVMSFVLGLYRAS
jgi:hypothetical protein